MKQFKRVQAMLLVFCIVLSLCGFTASAEAEEANNTITVSVAGTPSGGDSGGGSGGGGSVGGGSSSGLSAAVQPVADPPLRVLGRGHLPVLRAQPAAAPALQHLTAVPVMLPQARPPVKFLLPAIPSKKAPPLQAQRATTLLPTKLRLGTVNPIRFLLKAYHPTRTPVIQKHPVSHTLITTLQIQLLKKQVRLIRINPGEMTPNRQLNQGRIPRKPVLLPINLLQAGTGV